eukprot:TRINITY_DN116831_c0_g1_i1.p1 TRINITY_DN116831_c0_g1~~TRINITY_DN116831_c0_g1_i1.p1  ORF type:complete len:285 (+),score=35.92 TRINITY_DN116831_c0_g1_i1:51-905(+)
MTTSSSNWRPHLTAIKNNGAFDILIKQCTDLPKMDRWSVGDMYVTIALHNVDNPTSHPIDTASTKVISGSNSPKFNQRLTFPNIEGRMEQLLIRFSVWDKDKGKDEFVGDFSTSLASLFLLDGFDEPDFDRCHIHTDGVHYFFEIRGDVITADSQKKRKKSEGEWKQPLLKLCVSAPKGTVVVQPPKTKKSPRMQKQAAVAANVDLTSLTDEGKLREFFNSIDTDGNGYLEVDEMIMLYKTFDDFGLDSAESAVQKIVKQYNMLDDNKVSYDEFALLMMKLVAQ